MKRNISANALYSTLNSIPANIAVLGTEGEILAVNAHWREFASENLMTDPNVGVGLNYISICESDESTSASLSREVAKGIRSVLAGNLTSAEFEYPCHSASKRRWFRLFVSPIDLDGRTGCVTTHIDITDLRENALAQASLTRQLRSEQKQLAVARSIARMGSWETNLLTLEVKWSQETYDIFELNPKNFIPNHDLFLSLVHPDDRDSVHDAFLKSISTGEVHSVDHRILLSDGRVKYLTERWQIILDDDDVPFRAQGTCQDITERALINQNLSDNEAKLRRSQEIFSTAEKIGAIGAVALDFRTNLWEWSDQAYRIYGLDKNQFTPSLESFPDLIHPDDRDVLLGAIPLAKKGITPPPMEYRITRPDGAERLLRREATLARGPNGEILGIVGTLQDITDIRKNEKEKELLQERLRESQRLESIGRMTGGIAHDFNNLLTVILGSADVLSHNLPKNSSLQEVVELTKSAAERGAKLTDRLLAFSRRQALDPKPVNIKNLIRNMEGLIRSSLTEEISFSIVHDEDLWHCYVDGPQFENALLNLIVNARDAMPTGGHLTIEITNISLNAQQKIFASNIISSGVISEGDYIKILITDTGTGMTENTLHRVFDPFFTTKDIGKGSGLGLSMVYGFIRQSNGLVVIRSEIDSGTSVSLFLPRALDCQQAQQDSIDETIVPGGTESILVVEDDDLVRRQTVINLKALGYRITDACDGVEALKILQSGRQFDLLFTDVVMPRGLNGMQLAESAKGLCPNMPVLFTSGYAENHMTLKVHLDFEITLLSKPYSNLQLAETVRKILDSFDN